MTRQSPDRGRSGFVHVATTLRVLRDRDRLVASEWLVPRADRSQHQRFGRAHGFWAGRVFASSIESNPKRRLVSRAAPIERDQGARAWVRFRHAPTDCPNLAFRFGGRIERLRMRIRSSTASPRSVEERGEAALRVVRKQGGSEMNVMNGSALALSSSSPIGARAHSLRREAQPTPPSEYRPPNATSGSRLPALERRPQSRS